MNSLLTPEDFVKEKPLSLEEKVNILFEDFKSTLFPIFMGTKLFYGEKNLIYSKKEEYYEENIIFKNKWFINNNFCVYKDIEGKKYSSDNEFLLSKCLDISNYYYARYIYSLPKFKTIGYLIRLFYYSTDLGKSSYTIIKFSRDVYCSKEEIYKKGDIIVFDKYNKIVRPTTEEEITDILTNKKKF